MRISVEEPYRTSSKNLVVKELVNEPNAIHILAGGKPDPMFADIEQTTNLPDWNRINLEKHRKQVIANPHRFMVEVKPEVEFVRDESLYTKYSLV